MQLFVDALTVIDSSLLHPVHGLSADSWICDLVLEGALDSQSMVMDFGRVKKQVKQVIDSAFDHVLLVPEASDCLTHYVIHNGRATLIWRDASGRLLQYEAPQQAVMGVQAEAVDTASLAAAVQTALMAVMPATVHRVRVGLRHETITGAYYHYSHGLKKHDGHCQRMAHGHRSQLQIWRAGERSAADEAAWAARFNHRYIGTADDVMWQRDGRTRFAYDAPQGHFELELADDAVYLLGSDSTVECIAAHMAGQLAGKDPIVVKAYEGVQKGAMAAA